MTEPILSDLQAELIDLVAIEAESIGWLPLENGAYLHIGDPDERVITVVGVPDAEMVGTNVLLLI